jgi:hypothetical protein
MRTGNQQFMRGLPNTGEECSRSARNWIDEVLVTVAGPTSSHRLENIHRLDLDVGRKSLYTATTSSNPRLARSCRAC